MATILKPGSGILYMKVGTHAQEDLADIIKRKTREIEEAGYALWGYGGNTCHPETMVQPFVKSFEEHGQTVYLVMQKMNSSHFAYPVRAEEYSIDGIKWEVIPPAINVLGSRYALVINNLRQEEFDLHLDQTRVAVGNSIGAKGSKYVSGRVDKACLEVLSEEVIARAPAEVEDTTVRHIGLVAEIAAPYAVYVRNTPK